MTSAMHAQPAEGWQLEDNAAEAYERYLVPAIMTGWADQLLDLAALQPGERILDVGCGTGIVARRAAARAGAGGRVVGIDLNEGMLAVARRASSSRPGVEWRQGNATALPLPDGAFDAVFCQQMLQFVSDPPAALREMRRVLAPGGRAIVGVCRPVEHAPAYVALADALKRHAGPEAEAMMRSPFPSWSVDDVRALLGAAGFARVRVRIEVGAVRYPSPLEFLRREAASSPLAGPIGALDAGARAALVQELGAALSHRADDDGLALHIETYAAIGYR
ncbi:MAG TPA: methyltransferase domain-containing protein [Methylomirabilota bacterium]